MKRLLLAIGVLVVLGLGYGVSQTVIIQQLSGNETWQVGIGGGPAAAGFYTTTKSMRGGKTYALLATGTTVTQTVSQNVDVAIVIGAITTLNLSLPSAPFDQQTVMLACSQAAVTTLTVSAVGGSGQNVVGPTPGCSNVIGNPMSLSAMWTFVSSTPTATPPGTVGNWYRIQ